MEYFGYILAVLGILVSVYYGHKAQKLQDEKRRLSWADVQASSNDLVGKMLKDDFVPDLIFTPGLKGATFANLVQQELRCTVPVYVGVTREKSKVNELSIADYEVIVTSKWNVYIPRALSNVITQGKANTLKMLVVDDLVVSGDFLQEFSKLALTWGIEYQNLKSMSIVASKVAFTTQKGPSYYWMEIADTESIYFPWGKAK